MSGPAEPTDVTQWVENPEGGRRRGPRGLARAWVEVLVRPGRFFRNGVAPADQAPGLTFALAVAFTVVVGRLLLSPGSLPGYTRVVSSTGSPYLSAAVLAGVIGFLVAPLVLHLAAALATLSLIAVVDDRAGISASVASAAARCRTSGATRKPMTPASTAADRYGLPVDETMWV